MSTTKRIAGCLFAALCTLVALPLRAQIANVDDTTSTPTPGVGHDYIQMLSETVDPAHGSVSLRINLPTPKGRGMTLPFSIDYDSGSVNHFYSPTFQAVYWAPNNGTMIQGGWSYGYPSANFAVSSQTEGNYPQYQCSIASNYVFRDASGGLHPLKLADSMGPSGLEGQCNPSPYTVSTDPQFVAWFPPWTGENSNVPPPPSPFLVASEDGTVYHFSSSIGGANLGQWPPTPEDAYPPDTITDRNGNTITSTWSGSGSTFQFTFYDTIGRTLISSNGFGPSGTTNTLTVGGLTYQVKWKTTSPNYTTPSNYVGQPISLNNECSSIPANSQSETVIQSIALPNGKSFTFYYGTDSTPHGAPTNPYGLLSEIDYPTGAWVQYTWALVGMNELAGWTAGAWTMVLGIPGGADQPEYYWAPSGLADSCLYQYNTPVVTQRVVSFNGSSVALTQNFAYTTTWPTGGTGNNTLWTSKTTTVTDVDGTTGKSTSTVYNYSDITGNSDIWPTGTPVESSISYYDSQENLLRTVTKGWIDTYLPFCEVDTDYQYPNNGQSSGQSSGIWYLYYGVGSLVTNKKEYDYGLMTPAGCGQQATLPSATPTRETVTNYPSSFPTTSAGGTIYTIPSSVRVYAGGTSGTLTAETLYQYDGGTPTVGNLTQVTKLCLQSGSACSQGNSVTQHTYDQNGQILTTTDARGNVTQFSYLDTFNSCSGSAPPTSPSDAYLTKVTYPQTNSVSHIVSYCYDYAKGLLLSSTDENSQTTTYQYIDTLNRLTNVTYPPTGGTETYSYNDSVPSITHFRSIQGSSFGHLETTTFDGAGHAIQTQTLAEISSNTSDLSCASTSVYVYTTYDGEGRPHTVSNPNCGTGVSSPTDGTTTYAYDPLDRTTSVTEPDGSVVASVYSIGTDIFGNGRTTTTVTDEAGNQRESLTDGLGRLVQVEEPNPAIGSLPGTGSATASGSEQSTVTSAAPGTGTVTISGSEEEYAYYNGSQMVTIYDSGPITVTINGTSASVNYYQQSTPSSLASSLASAINSGMSFVRASASGATITITATSNGISTDYTLSTSSSSGYPQYFGSGSFHSQPSGSTLTGGESAGTTYDTGTVWLTANGHQTSAAYGQGDTSTTVASRLATAINNDSAAYVSASASGATISLASKATGSSTDYSLSGGSSTNQTTLFSAPSFSISVSGASLTGGASAGQVGSGALVTTYNYDILGNLLEVQQQGNSSNSAQWRTRTFSYNSLSQLVASSNPESGNMSYVYDADGNLLSKTMPAQNQSGSATVTLTYCYDPLNRLTAKGYTAQTCSNGAMPTPVASYSYDVGTNAIGHRTRMTDAAGSESWTYSPMGRVLSDARITNGVTMTTGYSYFDDGSILTMTYPSGHVVAYAVDTRSKPLSATDTTTSGSYIYYASGVSYTAPGELASLLNGSTLLTNAYFNNRLQPCRISVNSSGTQLSSCTASGVGNILDISYNFNPGADNGNVMGITNNIDNLRSQTFIYDPLNRLFTAQTSATYSTSSTKCWGEQYSYDPWANLLGTAVPSSSYTGCTQESPGPGGSVNANNQLSADTYDAAGNLTAMPNGSSYSYDAENHLLSTAGVNYTYDGDGQRVEKSSGTIYWHGAGGEALDESNLSGTLTNEYIFFGGARIARRDSSSNVFYYFSDHLGTARSIAEVPSGQTTATKCYDADLYPYGGERWYTDTCDSHYKFTSKERDPESGLDNFKARYNSSSLGRFMSPDWSDSPSPVPYAYLEDPQTLNLYSYARNNPMSLRDLNGHCDEDSGKGCFWQKLKNYFEYGHFVTNSNVEKALANDREQMANARAYLKSQTSISDQQLTRLSNKQTIDLANKVRLDQVEAGDDLKSIGLFYPMDSLQHAFSEHANDFGVSGNWNKQTGAEFQQALEDVVQGPNTVEYDDIEYRGQAGYKVFLDQPTGKAVIFDSDGNLVSAWDLSREQIQGVVVNGRLW